MRIPGHRRPRPGRRSDDAPIRVLAAPMTDGPEGNPYLDLLYGAVAGPGVVVRPLARRDLLRRVDVVHVHWPEYLVRWPPSPAVRVAEAAKVLGLLAVARRRGAVIVWTAHNLGSQEVGRDRLLRHFLRRFAAMTDVVISLSQAGGDQVRSAYPDLRRTPVEVVRHGHYRGAYPPGPSREQARRELGVDRDAVVFLSVGQVRRYKNMTGLVDAFRRGPDPREVLVVAGEPRDGGLAREITELAGKDRRVRLDLRRLPAGDLARWHAATDVVVLAYDGPGVLNSGAALLALSLGRPVVVTTSPTTVELRSVVGSDWVHLSDGSPGASLEAARAAVGTPGTPDLSALDWGPLGRETAAVYLRAVERRRSGSSSAG